MARGSCAVGNRIIIGVNARLARAGQEIIPVHRRVCQPVSSADLYRADVGLVSRADICRIKIGDIAVVDRQQCRRIATNVAARASGKRTRLD